MSEATKYWRCIRWTKEDGYEGDYIVGAVYVREKTENYRIALLECDYSHDRFIPWQPQPGDWVKFEFNLASFSGYIVAPFPGMNMWELKADGLTFRMPTSALEPQLHRAPQPLRKVPSAAQTPHAPGTPLPQASAPSPVSIDPFAPATKERDEWAKAQFERQRQRQLDEACKFKMTDADARGIAKHDAEIFARMKLVSMQKEIAERLAAEDAKGKPPPKRKKLGWANCGLNCRGW